AAKKRKRESGQEQRDQRSNGPRDNKLDAMQQQQQHEAEAADDAQRGKGGSRRKSGSIGPKPSKSIQSYFNRVQDSQVGNSPDPQNTSHSAAAVQSPSRYDVQGQGHGHRNMTAKGLMSSPSPVAGPSSNVSSPPVFSVAESSSLQLALSNVSQLEKELARYKHQAGDLEAMITHLKEQLGLMHKDAEEKATAATEMREKVHSCLEALVMDLSGQEARQARQALAVEGADLGRLVLSRASSGMHSNVLESWEDGPAAKELQKRGGELLQLRITLEGRRKAVGKALKAAVAGSAAELDAIQEDETVKMHLAALKKDEQALKEKKENFVERKQRHLRDLKRIQSEDASVFSKRPTLNKRYVLMNLL
ncbi:unnamed protein product, partial [Chrysoparadoxa australica]